MRTELKSLINYQSSVWNTPLRQKKTFFPSLSSLCKNTMRTEKSMYSGRHMFRKWGTLIFCHNLRRSSTHCSPHWRLPSRRWSGGGRGKKKMNSRFIYHASCLLRSTKDEKKGGKTNGKANQLHEKESCHLSNIHRCKSSTPPHSAFQQLALSRLNFENLIHY